MGIFSFLFSKATGGIVEAVGTAVNKNIRTLKGDKAEVAAAIHDEQMAVLAEHAAEFVARPTRTKLDSFVDFLNRLPRVIITFWIFAIFTWPAIDSVSFARYILSMDAIPDELWQLAMVVLSLYFGGRIISSDIRKPRLTEEQKKEALRQIEKREKAIAEARSPLIVEVPATRKPPPPRPPEKLPEIPQDRRSDAAIDAMIADLIRREAGYVNDPADDGGPTKYGITQRTLSEWRERSCSIDDVKDLTEAEAAKIYRAEYYLMPRIDTLPVALQAHVFDIGVNSGPRTAVKMLQQAVIALGKDLAVDGVLGPATLAVIETLPVADINAKMVAIRMAYYSDIIRRHPEKQRFANGWRARAQLFLRDAA